jgi:hypothetical protein
MRRVFKNKKFLYVIMGFLVASVGYLYLEYRYEQKTLQAITQSILHEKGLNRYDNQAVVLAAMKKTHLLMAEKETGQMGLELSGMESAFTSPLLRFAITKDGACGGNSLVLAQILKGMGYDVRPAQMKVSGKFGGHIVLEVKIDGHWAVLDPLFNLSFKHPEGRLAGFAEVRQNWNYYKAQTPAGYNPAFTFEDVRYTNWNKVPVLGSCAKFLITLFIGKERAECFSLRSLFLNPKKMLFTMALFFLGLSCISILNRKYFHISLRIPSIKLKPLRRGKPALNAAA